MDGAARQRVLKVRRRCRTFIVDDDPGPTLDVELAARSLVDRVRSGEVAIPMLPKTATEALSLAADPNASATDLSELIESDPLVTAAVVRIANTAQYGRVATTSLRNAIARLGTALLRDVLYQVVADAHIFKHDKGRFLVIERVHALAVARLARSLCKRLGVASQHAFLCGLLHDVGRAVAVGVLTQHRGLGQGPTPELGLLDEIHIGVGEAVAERWDLPALVREAIHFHHDYRDPETGAYSQIGNVMHAAERLALHAGLGRKRTIIEDPGETASFWELGLDATDIEELMREAEHIAGPIRARFG